MRSVRASAENAINDVASAQCKSSTTITTGPRPANRLNDATSS